MLNSTKKLLQRPLLHKNILTIWSLINILPLAFNPLLVNFPILYPLKTPENQMFSGVFRGYKAGTLARNGLIYLRNKKEILRWSWKQSIFFVKRFVLIVMQLIKEHKSLEIAWLKQFKVACRVKTNVTWTTKKVISFHCF